MELTDLVFEIAGLEFYIPAFAQQLLLASAFGLVFGIERAFREKVASLRTFAIICCGSCLFSMLSVHVGALAAGTGPYDVSRIAANIVTGIGFVGGGVIFKSTKGVAGVTTAALLWLAAAVGMAIGFNKTLYAIWAVIAYLMILALSVVMRWIIIQVRLTQRSRRRRVIRRLREQRSATQEGV